MKLQARQIDIIDFLKGVVQSFASMAEHRNISFTLNSINESLYGYVDKDKLEKIMTNLMSNAFKFTPEGGEIILDFGLRNAELLENSKIQNLKSKIVEIRISNTGPGIPAERLEKIFDRFYQADSTYKKDGEGSGIGLALTKELVEVHHGTIQVESEPNRITTFAVLLPIGKEHLKEEEILIEPETRARSMETGKEILRKEAIEDLPISSIQDAGIPASRTGQFSGAEISHYLC
jgi:signal transduction histidine kinase